MPDGDYIGSGIIQEDIQAEMDAEGNEGRCKVDVIEINESEYIRKDWLLKILKPASNLNKERFDSAWLEGREFLREQIIERLNELSQHNPYEQY